MRATSDLLDQLLSSCGLVLLEVRVHDGMGMLQSRSWLLSPSWALTIVCASQQPLFGGKSVLRCLGVCLSCKIGIPFSCCPQPLDRLGSGSRQNAWPRALPAMVLGGTFRRAFPRDLFPFQVPEICFHRTVQGATHWAERQECLAS